MKRYLESIKIRIICASIFIVIVCLVASIAYANLQPSQDIGTATESSPLSARDIYENAYKNTVNKDMLKAEVSYSKNTYSTQSFQENANATILFKNYSDEDCQTLVNKTTTIGQHAFSTTVFNHDKDTYLKIGNGMYRNEIDIQNFQGEYIPLILMNSNNYKKLSTIFDDSHTIIEFYDPFEIEKWAAPKGAELQSASGSVKIRENQIDEIHYNLTYTYKGVSYQASYSSKITQSDDTIDLEKIGQYTKINDLQGPLSLERAYAYLICTDTICASLYENIDCTTFGDSRKQTINISTSEVDNNYTATLKIDVRQTSKSWGGAVSKQSQTITYKDGIYKSKVNKEKAVKKTTITPDYMKSYSRDFLVGTVILPEKIIKVRTSEEESIVKYTFTLRDDALSDRIRKKASQSLYSKDNSLDGLYKTDSLYAYISIYQDTGLPAASGIQYSGSHTLNDTKYTLTYKTGQTYKFS